MNNKSQEAKRIIDAAFTAQLETIATHLEEDGRDVDGAAIRHAIVYIDSMNKMLEGSLKAVLECLEKLDKHFDDIDETWRSNNIDIDFDIPDPPF